MSTVISIENLWKEYRLGVIGHGTLTHDLQSWFARVRKKEDPNAKISPALTAEKSRVDGDRFWALQDVNIQVKDGEVLGIIGKNGAGKSTMLKILSRVTAPSRGCIKVKGRLASLLEVGTGFHPELTGRENIFLNGAILGMSKNEVRKKLDEIIDFSGVDQHIDTPVKRFSSGMYVRLAFAVAAHLEPEILVVDEVLAVGDADFQKKCMGKMGEVANMGRTVLFVSHNMGAINNLCTRVVVLKNGCVGFDGTTKEGVQNYLTGTMQSAEMRLEVRKDRIGSGELRAIDYWLEDGEGNICDHLMSGQKVNIIVKYSNIANLITGDVEIKIKSSNGIVLTSLSNVYSGVGELTFDRQNLICCTINKLPLPEGSYYFDILLRSSGKQVLDFIENAGVLKVSSGNFYKSGVDHRGIRWGLLVDHHINIRVI